MPSRRSSGPSQDRWSSSEPRPGCGLRSSWRSSGETSTTAARPFTYAASSCAATSGPPRRGEASVPLQAVALEALDQLPESDGALVFPALRGGYIDLHNFRARSWRPAQVAAGIEPIRRPYDLRHTYATFALRAGISIFDLSRFMGASLAIIDKHYGHLARDGREHAVALLDAYARDAAAWTLNGRRTIHRQSAQGQRLRNR